MFTAFEHDELYDRALAVYGERNQIIVAVEELSELQKELCKYLRGEDVGEKLAEEMADVTIMLEQLVGIFGNDKRMLQFKCNKKARLWIRVLEKERKKNVHRDN